MTDDEKTIKMRLILAEICGINKRYPESLDWYDWLHPDTMSDVDAQRLKELWNEYQSMVDSVQATPPACASEP